VEKTGRKRPWKSQERFPLSHSFNNNKLDDRDHFLQNAKTSVASLRRLITPTRNADHDQPGTLIIFIGIRKMTNISLISLSAIEVPRIGSGAKGSKPPHACGVSRRCSRSSAFLENFPLLFGTAFQLLFTTNLAPSSEAPILNVARCPVLWVQQ
jgi:hypothetical protein